MAVTEREFEVVAERDVPVRMRDETILRADIFRPAAAGRFPGLLFRTPYDKRRSDHGRETYIPVGRAAARQGYVVALQDIRGRFASDGEFFPFFAYDRVLDAADGYDTVEWLAALPHCDGKVGTFGDSYGGWAQWELARLRPPHLVAMFPSGMPATAIDYPILRVRRVLWLICRMAPEALRRARGATPGPHTAQEAYAVLEEVERDKWYWFLPWRDLPPHVLGDLTPFFTELLGRIPVDYVAPQRAYDQIETPMLHLTGWFDISPGGSIEHFTGMRSEARTAHARRNQRLIVGPWTHMDPYYDLPGKCGELDFGAAAADDYIGLLTRWFDHWLKGAEPGLMDEPPIQLFVMGDNVWRAENEWPLARTVYMDYFLHSQGAANTPAGDGALSRNRPGDEPPDRYTYDPRDPVMSTFSRGAYSEPRDQGALAYRRDNLVYLSESLTEDLEATGNITVQLYATSTAPDTDFTAKVCDVFPDGRAIGLCSGIVRARYRDSTATPSQLARGEIYEYTIRLEPTAYVFKAGHRLRVDIASSDFPNFDRNHNTGADPYQDALLQPAHQTIYHDQRHVSRLIVPIIPR